MLDGRAASAWSSAVSSSTIRPPSQPTRRALRKQERLRVTAPGTRPSPLPRRQWPGIPAGWLVIAQPIEQGFLLRLPIARAEPASSRKPRSPARTRRGLPPSAARNASSIASDFGVEPLSHCGGPARGGRDVRLSAVPCIPGAWRVAARSDPSRIADRPRHELDAAHRPQRHRVSSERDTGTSDAALASFSSHLATRVDRLIGMRSPALNRARWRRARGSQSPVFRGGAKRPPHGSDDAFDSRSPRPEASDRRENRARNGRERHRHRAMVRPRPRTTAPATRSPTSPRPPCSAFDR